MKLVCIIICDILVLTAVALQPAVLRRFGSPPIRGFHCNDETIRYPYVESTVSIPVLYVVGVAFAVTIIVLTEVVLARKSQDDSMRLLGMRIPMWMINCYKFIGVFSFGAASVQVIAQGGTYTIGRLRPHFIDVCNPDVDCTSPELRYAYVTNYTCRGTSLEKINDSRLSFPSGHACFSAFAALFTVLYIQSRWNIRSSHLFKYTFNWDVLCSLLSWVTSLSRIHDYQHHWSDVVVGLVIGITTAVFVATFMLNLCEVQEDRKERRISVSSIRIKPIIKEFMKHPD